MTTFFWRDIPSHVMYKAGREKYRKQLDPKFETAIDRAAMRAGKGSSDAYIAEWRRETNRFDGVGGPAKLVETQIRQLEQEFSDEILEKTIKAGGIKPKP
ncbi:MAG TPA: hypothetical protein EYG10_06975 [Gammaproteobacteria bacterium]|nr:hypothetical protein [Gammaproteobacteria bacterium]